MKLIKTIAYLSVIGLFWAATGCAEPRSKTESSNPSKQNTPDSSAKILDKIQAVYRKAPSVQADFEQEVYQATLARTKSSRGSLVVVKPDKVRWEIHAPERSIMVSDGRKVNYFTPDAGAEGNGQVIVRPAQFLSRHTILQILNGSIPIQREFKLLKVVKVSNSRRKIRLQPKKTLSDVAKIEMLIDPKFRIVGIEIEHRSGNRTKISLKNLRLKDKLPTSLFQFTPPKGTEIVTE